MGHHLYQLAFEHTPSDYYVGINAAAKSVLLDESDIAHTIAEEVGSLIGDNVIPGDYWKTATVAEVQLIQKNYKKAGELYQAAVDIAPLEYGSQKSKLNQARLLLSHLNTTEEEKKYIEDSFLDLHN